jgi:hypothetical protein
VLRSRKEKKKLVRYRVDVAALLKTRSTGLVIYVRNVTLFSDQGEERVSSRIIGPSFTGCSENVELKVPTEMDYSTTSASLHLT